MAKTDRNTVEKQVKQIFADQLDLDMEEIKETAILTDDLGIDSFSSIEIVYELEDKFGIEIPEKDLADVKTVDDIVTYIISRLSR
ncbi:Acyl carrier protein [subsurface metagenome]